MTGEGRMQSKQRRQIVAREVLLVRADVLNVGSNCKLSEEKREPSGHSGRERL